MLKKAICTITILAQTGAMSAATAVLADTAVPETAESNLVRTVLTLKGLDLPANEMKSQVDSAVKRYVDTSPSTGRAERLETALVDFEIMTPQQAKNFTSGVNAADANVASQSIPTPEAYEAALKAQMELFAKVNPVGAQFSACTTAWVLTAGGAIIAFVGAALASYNPTCHEDTTQPGWDCSYNSCDSCTDSGGDSYDCNCHWVNDTCYPTKCDDPNDYPHERSGNITAIAGGVAAIAGITMLIIDRDQCFN
jgi:hypothetical protein